jgi:trigger factor
MDDYCKYTGTDVNAMKESYREEATARVKMQLVIEAVGKAENIQADEADVEKLIADYAKKSNMEPDAFKKNLSEDDREYLSDRAVAEKTVRFVVDNARLVKEEKKAEDAQPEK